MRRRPSLPGSAKVVRLKESVYQQRRERKTSTGFSDTTDSAFAEIVLHSLPNENRRNVNLPCKITVATALLQNNACGHEIVLFCLIIPCVHCLFMFYFYKKRKWLFWFCVHRHQSMRLIVQSIDRTVIDPCICIECKLRS